MERLSAQPYNPDRDHRRNIEINIGKSCNNRCVFCLDGMPKREDRSYMPFDQMRSELSRWYEEGHRSIQEWAEKSNKRSAFEAEMDEEGGAMLKKAST